MVIAWTTLRANMPCRHTLRYAWKSYALLAFADYRHWRQHVWEHSVNSLCSGFRLRATFMHWLIGVGRLYMWVCAVVWGVVVDHRKTIKAPEWNSLNIPVIMFCDEICGHGGRQRWAVICSHLHSGIRSDFPQSLRGKELYSAADCQDDVNNWTCVGYTVLAAWFHLTWFLLCCGGMARRWCFSPRGLWM